ncbi:substrate-binding domain-containing protein [bacterium]|nr:substrate-binding domain-containing protein [bacterium]MCI0603454.1 substrate-binding domain-containing protein [bacterium]
MKIRIVFVVLSFVLSVLIGLTLSMGNRSATGGPTSKLQPLIGFSMDTLKESRWQKDKQLFVAAAEKLGARVLVQSANSDDTRQMQDIEALLSNNVDVLVIVPHNARAMAKAVNKAHEAGVPVIAYDRLITDCDLDLYISFDNVKVGEKQAQYALDHLPKGRKLRMVRIFGAKTDNNALLFKQGQDNILNPLLKSGDVQVLHEDWAENWKPENAKKIANAAITSHGSNFDAILAANDGTAGGAIQALAEEGLAGKILVTGQDAELVACQRIAAGTQAMTIYKPIHKLSNAAAELAVKLAKKMPVIATATTNNGKMDVPSVLLEVITVTRDNLKSTVIADGYHSYQDVYGNIPADQRPAP